MKFSDLLHEALQADRKVNNFVRAGVKPIAIKKAIIERDYAFSRLDAFMDDVQRKPIKEKPHAE